METSQCRIADIAEALFAGRPPTRLKPGRGVSKRRIVNQRDVSNRIAPATDLDLIDLPSTSELERLALIPGDIVLTSRGALRVAVAAAEHDRAIPGANLIVLRLRPPIDPVVLAAYLRHPRVEAELLKEFAGSVTPGFSVHRLGQVKFMQPDEAEQTNLGKLVRATEKYEHALRRTLDSRIRITQELVFRAFSEEDGCS